jgi:GT2 family glycosyltransferase
MKVYILLPVHNRREVTAKFVKCLVEQNYKNFHLLILPHYGSDVEYTVRAHRKGFRLLAPALNYIWMIKQPDIQDIKNENYLNFFKKYFSRKSIESPLVFSGLNILACPWNRKFTGLLRIWKRSILTLYKVFSHS